MFAGKKESSTGQAEPSAAWQRDFLPAISLERLEDRARMLRRIRDYFQEQGFLEVETPLLSRDVVVDRHIDPLELILPEDPSTPRVGMRLWLQTSPEFAMKRLLAGMGRSIFQITKAFRAGERGPLHNPEFTMVEWYEVEADYAAGIRRLGDLANHILARGKAEVLTYREVFQRHLRVDPQVATPEELREAGRQRGLDAPAFPTDDRDAWLDWLLVELIQPRLGVSAPVILCDYPASQAALARVRVDAGVEVAERFELYVDGLELANGYHELLEADILLARNKRQNAGRRRDGKQELPNTSRLLAAMQAGLPPSAGVALGFDRLVMVAVGATSLAEVLPFPIERA